MLALSLPVALGDFVLLAPLSTGPTSSVYLGVHGTMIGAQHFCAVKIKTLREDGAERGIERFMHEARTVVSLSHRSICHVFEVGQAENLLFVAMEFIQGQTLLSVLRRLEQRSDCLEPALAIYVIREVLDALDYAHRFVDPDTQLPEAVIHSDVTPLNILVSYAGEPKVIDFSAARSVNSIPDAAHHSFAGDPCYISPELASGGKVDGRADQYSAAVVLSELLIGRRFHQDLSVGEQLRGVAHDYRPQGFVALEPNLRAILDRALSVDPADRYRSCAAFADALAEYQLEYRHHVHAGVLRDKMEQLFEAEKRALRDELREQSRRVDRILPAARSSGRPLSPNVNETIEVRFRVSSDTGTDSQTHSSQEAGPKSTQSARVSTEDQSSSDTSSPRSSPSEDALFEEATVQSPSAVQGLGQGPQSTIWDAAPSLPSSAADPSTDTMPSDFEIDVVEDAPRSDKRRAPDAFEEDTIVDPGMMATDSDSGASGTSDGSKPDSSGSSSSSSS